MTEQPKAHALMRFTQIKFDRVIPEHILADINMGYDGTISRTPVIRMKVNFHHTGEAYAVECRCNGYELGGYTPGHFRQGPFMNFTPEVVAYLSQAADEALAIVQPIVTTH